VHENRPYCYRLDRSAAPGGETAAAATADGEEKSVVVEAQAWMEEKLAAAAPATPPYDGDAPPAH